jgi:hypothetical protein
MLKVDVGDFLSLSFTVYFIFNILRTPPTPTTSHKLSRQVIYRYRFANR